MSRLILGAAVHPLGAYPSGWRYPGAHRDPRRDGEALRRIATLAEAARLDFLVLGDRPAGSAETGTPDPAALARLESFAAAGFLASITERIGIIATANAAFADPYEVARASATLDTLSGGRFGLGLTAELGAREAEDHGLERHTARAVREARSAEFTAVLRRLWDSIDDEALLADVDGGRFVDAAGVHPAGFSGTHVRVAGPLDAVRPPQGHPVLLHEGGPIESLAAAARVADLVVVPVGSLDDAFAVRESLRALAFQAGRDDREVKLVVPVLPIIGETRAHARAIADELSELLPIAEDDPVSGAVPGVRSIAHLETIVGTRLSGSPDEPIDAVTAARFDETGAQLLEIVAQRTGRTIAGERPPTLRHLVAAVSVPTSMIVGTADDVAAEFADWVEADAADGFHVSFAVQPAQFEAFALGVVPELRRRGLVPDEYGDGTLRERLGLGVARNVHAGALRGAGSDDAV